MPHEKNPSPGLTTTNLRAIEDTPPPVNAGSYPAVLSGACSFLVGIIMAVASILVIVDASGLPTASDPLGPAAFPFVIGGLLGLIGIALIVTNVRYATVLVRSSRSGVPRGALIGRGSLVKAALMIAALLLFALVLPFLGFFASATVLYVVAALLIGARRGWHLLITGVLLSGAIVLLFDRLIGLTLPAGPWGF